MALVFAAASSSLDGQEIRWTGTTSYARGSYVFDAPTQTYSLSSGLGVSWGPIDVGGSLPLLLQNSQLVSQVGGVPLATGGQDNGVVGRRQPGETLGTGRAGGGGGMSQAQVAYRDDFTWTLGDPFLSASARLHEGSGLVRSVQAQVATKAPLRGLDSGVGTGEWDVGAGASAFASVGGTYAFVDAAYWWYGDLPDLELVDGLSYGVGLSRPILDSRGSVMVSYFGAKSPIASMDAPMSVGLGASYSPRVGRSFSGGVTMGLSESSPDVSVYAGWSVRIH
jgi:hypothetical protein